MIDLIGVIDPIDLIDLPSPAEINKTCMQHFEKVMSYMSKAAMIMGRQV